PRLRPGACRRPSSGLRRPGCRGKQDTPCAAGKAIPRRVPGPAAASPGPGRRRSGPGQAPARPAPGEGLPSVLLSSWPRGLFLRRFGHGCFHYTISERPTERYAAPPPPTPLLPRGVGRQSMSDRSIFLLSPYRLPTTHQVLLNEDEMAAWLNGYVVLWHPALLLGAVTPPQIASPYDHEMPSDNQVFVRPESPPLFQPDDWPDRVRDAGSLHFSATPGRDETLTNLRK